MRHQSPTETYGKPTHEPMVVQLALCPKPECKTPLEFWTDALGRVRERCPTCRGQFKRPRVLKPQVSQTALTNAPDAQLLPRVAPGQLRCQCCARGVEDGSRFCSVECRYARRRNRQRSPEYRAKMSATVRGRVMSPETRERIAASRRGVPLSPETRAKISAGQLKRFQSPDTRTRISEALRGRRRISVFSERDCPCGVRYVPTSPNQKWHARDCPARRAA